MIKKTLYFIFILLALTSAELAYLNTPVIKNETGAIYFLKPGTPKPAFIAELKQQGIIHYSFLFSLFIYPQKHHTIKTGEYHFPKGSTPLSIWKQVINATGLVYHPFTIIPGWNFHQLRNALIHTDSIKNTISHLTDQDVMKKLDYPNLSPEGQFFPETYFYTRGVPDTILLKHALQLMTSKLKSAWESRAPGLPYKNSNEALIAASIIEKEAYLNEERPLIAGVLINRLNKNMRLQFDPTVIYGMGDHYQGKILKSDLMQDSPYNSYLHTGLPPTPIAMPSLNSIQAALHPAINDYLYFVAKGKGSHQFSKTLQEHNAAISAVLNKK